MSLRTLFVSFALGYAALRLAFRGAHRRAERRIRTVTLTCRGRSVSLRALEDTGNELLDPVTGRRVLVAEARALAPLLDDPAPLSEQDVLSALEALRAQGLACRLLPCRSVTERSALLLCFLPDRAEADGARAELLVAVSRNTLSADGGYEAVMPQIS